MMVLCSNVVAAARDGAAARAQGAGAGVAPVAAR